MQAVIVAAGMSSRLYPLTSETPKCLLQINGNSLIERMLDLLSFYGVDDIVVVVGFCRQKLKKALKERVRYVFNPFFATTNNMSSLWFAMPHLREEDFLYLHSDVIFHKDMLRGLLGLVSANSDSDVELLVDFQHSDQEAMKVRVENGKFIESSKNIPLNKSSGEWTGIARINRRGIKALQFAIEEILEKGYFQDYDMSAFNRMAKEGHIFSLASTRGLPWCEIDTFEDIEYANVLFKGVDKQ